MDFEYQREINYYETDKMGVVHHSNYIRFLEETRCRWIKQLGISMEDLEKIGITIPVLEINCQYKNHITSGDIISIKPTLLEYNGIRMTVSYTVTDLKTKKEVVSAYTKHCFTNKELKPINMKKNNIQVHKIFESLLNNLNN